MNDEYKLKEKDNDLIESFRMSNILASKWVNFSITQQKLFYIVLAHLNYGLNKNNEVKILKKHIFDWLGYTSKNKYTRTRKELEQLSENSFVSFGNDEEFCSGFLFANVRLEKDYYYVFINPYYENILLNFKNRYVKLLTKEVLSFNSKYSMMLYQVLLKLKNKNNNITFTTKQLKELFGLTEEAYVRKDGTFGRKMFEKYTIDVAVKEINTYSRIIQNLKYEKIKNGNIVEYYSFSFDLNEDDKELMKIKEPDWDTPSSN